MSLYDTVMAQWGPEIRKAQGLAEDPAPSARPKRPHKTKWPPECSQCGRPRKGHGAGRGMCARCYQQTLYREQKARKAKENHE